MIVWVRDYFGPAICQDPVTFEVSSKLTRLPSSPSLMISINGLRWIESKVWGFIFLFKVAIYDKSSIKPQIHRLSNERAGLIKNRPLQVPSCIASEGSISRARAGDTMKSHKVGIFCYLPRYTERGIGQFWHLSQSRYRTWLSVMYR